MTHYDQGCQNGMRRNVLIVIALLATILFFVVSNLFFMKSIERDRNGRSFQAVCFELIGGGIVVPIEDERRFAVKDIRKLSESEMEIECAWNGVSTKSLIGIGGTRVHFTVHADRLGRISAITIHKISNWDSIE